AILQSDDAQERQILDATAAYIKDLAKVKELTVASLEVDLGTAERVEPEVHVPAAPQPAAAESRPEASAEPETIVITSEDVVAEASEISQSVLTLLSNPRQYLGKFFSSIRRPAITLGLLFGLLLLLRVSGAVLNTLASLPLIAPTLKLIGLTYVFWFASQNLLRGQKRQEVGRQIQALWQQVRGDQTGTARLEPAAEPKALLEAADAPAPTDTEPETAQPKMFAGVVGTVQVLIPLTGVADVEALRAKIEKDLSRVEGEIKSLSGRLSNQGFVEKAPAEVVQGARDALAEAETQAEILRDRLARL
ncbi:MAG: valine--tRNA ligase, partial [Leptolyngbya sp. SIO4C5]|nr:valine--tRNA ligase [Leptolyngbya sp. SIO4C5]